MDGREGMHLSGPTGSYYLNRGMVSIRGSGPGSGSGLADGTGGGSPIPSGFKHLSGANISLQSASVGGGNLAPSYHVENPSHSFAHGVSVAAVSPVTPSDPGKKKRGRPRKYAPDGANVSLGLSPVSSTPSSGGFNPTGPKRTRGRPRGSGWKQQLSSLGEWMNSSAGLAFTPHVIHAGPGEDIAEKILLFAQQRPRALCIMSAHGSASAVTLRQPLGSGGNVTYEGRFEILCLSGSYLVAESGGPRNRTGGISISVCSPDGHVIGGAIGGRLIAASPVQVVACSFVYAGKAKTKAESSNKDEKNTTKPAEQSSTPVSAALSQNQTPNSSISPWPPVSWPDSRNSQTEIDLTRG